jgi:hypothetical protein
MILNLLGLLLGLLGLLLPKQALYQAEPRPVPAAPRF